MTVDYMDDCAVHEPAPAAFGVYGLASAGYPQTNVSSYLMSSPDPVWLWKVRSRLEELGRLQLGWDSYGAKPVSASARTTAYSVLRQLVGPHTPEPTLVPTSDGSVQIEWHTRGMDLEIRVLSPTRVGVFLDDDLGDVASVDGELRYDFTALGEAVQVLSSR